MFMQQTYSFDLLVNLVHYLFIVVARLYMCVDVLHAGNRSRAMQSHGGLP
jgi:hypothetical protein